MITKSLMPYLPLSWINVEQCTIYIELPLKTTWKLKLVQNVIAQIIMVNLGTIM